MEPQTIRDPEGFVVTPYRPGLVIEHTGRGLRSDLDVIRARFDVESVLAGSLESALGAVDQLVQELGVASMRGDFARALTAFAGVADPRAALTIAGDMLDAGADASWQSRLRCLLERSGILRPPPGRVTRLRCHAPGATELEEGATHFGYALGSGVSSLEWDGRTYPIHPGSSFCVPGGCVVRGSEPVVLITCPGYAGSFTLGGPIGDWGQLRYIDGCTDTLLVPPVRRGDPCLNALYFPADIKQTRHTHPTLRAGVVASGSGVCRTPTVNHPLEPGSIFFLPPETWHGFWTFAASADGGRSALTVVAFHPDSDFGATDDEHPMLNRTYFGMLERLRSAARMTDVRSDR